MIRLAEAAKSAIMVDYPLLVTSGIRLSVALEWCVEPCSCHRCHLSHGNGCLQGHVGLAFMCVIRHYSVLGMKSNEIGKRKSCRKKEALSWKTRNGVRGLLAKGLSLWTCDGTKFAPVDTFESRLTSPSPLLSSTPKSPHPSAGNDPNCGRRD